MNKKERILKFLEEYEKLCRKYNCIIDVEVTIDEEDYFTDLYVDEASPDDIKYHIEHIKRNTERVTLGKEGDWIKVLFKNSYSS